MSAPCVVYIEWLDAETNMGWMPKIEESKRPLTKCKSVGFLIGDYEDRVIVAASYDPDNDNVNSVTVIPKVGITLQKEIVEI